MAIFFQIWSSHPLKSFCFNQVLFITLNSRKLDLKNGLGSIYKRKWLRIEMKFVKINLSGQWKT